MRGIIDMGKNHRFFRFPSEKTDIDRRKVWIHRCQRGEKNWKPSKNAVLCADYFESDAFERDPFRLAQMGYENPKARLKKDAMPTRFRTKSFADGLPSVTRGAFRKRQTDEMLRDIFNDEQTTETNPPKAFDGDRNEPYELDKHEVCSVPIQAVEDIDACEDTLLTSDEEYMPSEYSELDESETDADCDTDTDDETEPVLYLSANPQTERQFLVSETSLAQLFQYCSHQSGSSSFCGMTCQVKLMQHQGVMITVETKCLKGHTTIWNSQSMHGTMPWGNLLCASSILLSGGCATQVLRMFKFMKLPIFSMGTFINIQRCYTVPDYPLGL
ncbi:uncharacterized protein LOC124253985 [Haliotis rubra]|uniref:uncharacterized protein LOC124253985 n=1 Tax=Haliotis rubra TaxID=36100 RepID=UPI001EE62FC9|nr:uncharacterized protein LOC124253985 [Haliotis rubra]